MATGSITQPFSVTDYNDNTNNTYHLRVVQIGRGVIVSGEVKGTGTGEYLTTVKLPKPNVSALSLVFRARCVEGTQAGEVRDIRCGSSFYIYLDAAMASGSRWQFSFAYCAE